MNPFANPELRRNYRSQLRPGRVMATAGIIAALSLSYGYACYKGGEGVSPEGEWGQQLFAAAFWIQVVVLAIGGGFACLVAISREKEQNTFDFQRVTRLTPLELALGKLFGAPALSYFVVLCLLPVAIVGALVGRMNFALVLAAYVVLLISAAAWHGLALLISLLMERNAASAGGLFYLVLIGMASMPDSGPLGLGMMSPFYAGTMLGPHAVQASAAKPIILGSRYWDSFFGVSMPHGVALATLSAIFLAWILLALSRNIKRDPAVYELYTPAQSLGLALYMNVLLIGFFEWKGFDGHEAHRLMTFLNLSLFFGIGLTVMRNRDRLRRRINELGDSASGWLASFWPGTYVLGGFIAMGLGIIAGISQQYADAAGWNVGAAVTALVLSAFWLARDILFIQWMNLTRVRRPMVMAILYLTIYYTCAGIVFGTLAMFNPSRAPFAAIFLPSLGLSLEPRNWEAHTAAWMLAVAAQVPLLCVLAMMQKQKLAELSARPEPVVAAPVSAN